MNPELQNKTGLTLIEIIIAVAVIAMLATMLIGIATVIDTQSKEKATEATFALLEAAMDEYEDLTGQFPIQGERYDVNAPAHSELLYTELDSIPASANILHKISDKLIQDKFQTVPPPATPRYEIYDLWGTAIDYIYDPNNTYPLLRSAGPDRRFDTLADNITNR